MLRVVIGTCAVLLALLPVKARAEWFEAKSEHFLIYGNGEPDEIKNFATDLERYDRALHILRGIPDFEGGSATRITVFMLPNMDMLRAVYMQNANGNETGVGGFYSYRAGEPVAFLSAKSENYAGAPAPREILQHEYAHHFMYAAFPGAAFPAWVTEGYAEFHASARVNKAGDVEFGFPVQTRANSLYYGAKLSMADMLSGDVKRLSDETVPTLYARGWLLMHMLTFEPDGQKQLAQYLIGINKGKPPLEAAAAFGDLQQLDKRLNAYMRTKLPATRVPADQLKFKPVEVRKLNPGEAAIMAIRLRSKRGVGPRLAATVLEEARRVAQAYPNEPLVQTTLAEAALDAHQPAESIAAAERALAVAPNTIEAQLLKGRAETAIAEKAKDTSEATWSRIRRTFIAANRIDPDDPRPLILYYMSYKASGQTPTQNAKVGLARAFELAPEDTGVRTLWVRQMLVDGAGPEARAALAPLAYTPHGGAFATWARKLMETIDSGGASAALAELDKGTEDKGSGAAK